MHYIKTLLAIGMAALLTACGQMDAVKGDLPEDYQAHLKAHPGDIRFNRPIIKWTVADDPGPDWHVLPDKVYEQIYRDKLNKVWDTMGLDQGTGKAYDVVVEVPILYYFPGSPFFYMHGFWSYKANVVDPETGVTVASWGGGNNKWVVPFWGGHGPDNAPCRELGHWVSVPTAVLATVTPLYAVKAGDFTNFEEAADELMKMPAKWSDRGAHEVNFVWSQNFHKLLERYPGKFDDLILHARNEKGEDGYFLAYTTIAETRAAAEKAGYQIDFPDTCHDRSYYTLFPVLNVDISTLDLKPAPRQEKEDKYKLDL